MANTSYVLLEKITVGAAGANTVKFSNIPQTGYTDLVIKHSTRMTEPANSNDISVNFNGVGWNTSVASKRVYGSGSAAASDSNPMFGGSNGASSTANTFNNSEIYIPNYTSSAYKSYSVDQVSENNAAAAYAMLGAQLWQNTSAITSIELRVSGGSYNFVQYSTFYLYGVAKLGTTPAIYPKATGGDTIMTDGTYWYHTFISSGTFTPASALTCDYLVVAGGGAGGNNSNYGGGGGAGGLRSTVTATGGGGSLESALSLALNTSYTVTIGAGGALGTDQGGSGSNSVFSTITSTGGGGGAGGSNGLTGGSGGGAGYHNALRTGGAGTANQGYAGGNNWFSGAPFPSGGGGGAGAVGVNATATVNGNGGNGVATSISGSSVTYAGGGGGGSPATATVGTGGTGGGGNGGVGTVGSAGTANRGGGGGNNATGGSGIVIVRYAV